MQNKIERLPKDAYYTKEREKTTEMAPMYEGNEIRKKERDSRRKLDVEFGKGNVPASSGFSGNSIWCFGQGGALAVAASDGFHLLQEIASDFRSKLEKARKEWSVDS